MLCVVGCKKQKENFGLRLRGFLNREIYVCCRFLRGCWIYKKNKNNMRIKVLDDSS